MLQFNHCLNVIVLVSNQISFIIGTALACRVVVMIDSEDSLLFTILAPLKITSHTGPYFGCHNALINVHAHSAPNLNHTYSASKLFSYS